MSEIFIWRWCFCELLTAIGVYTFIVSVYPIKKGQRRYVCLMGFVSMVVYLALLFGCKLDPFAGGIVLRALIYIPQYVLVPMLFIEKNGWRYVSFGLTNSFIASFILDAVVFDFILGLFDKSSGTRAIDVSLMIYDSPQYTSLFYIWCACTYILYLLLIMVYKLLQKRNNVWRHFTNISIVMNIISFTVLTITSVDAVQLESQTSSICLSALITLSVMGCICRGMYHDKKQALIETEYLHMQQQLLITQMKELDESQTQTRKLRHDLKNHIETIHMLVQCDKIDMAKEYINQMINE